MTCDIDYKPVYHSQLVINVTNPLEILGVPRDPNPLEILTSSRS